MEIYFNKNFSSCIIDDIGVCPKGWKERPGSSTCYYISDQSDKKTWENADIACRRHQGNLVKVDSIPERVNLTMCIIKNPLYQ